MYAVANNVQGTVQNNPLTNAGTNLVVDSATDTKLNALNTYPFFLSLWNVNTNPNDAGNNMEVVKVTARVSSQNYTIVRGQQGTSGVQHNFGDNVALLWTKSNADDKQNQDGSTTYATDTGSANAYVITLTPAPTQYTKGMHVTFIPVNSNSGASTINVNSLGNKNITKTGATALDANDIVAGIPNILIYDGTEFQLVGFTTRLNNYSATTNPGVGNDNTEGYQLGSVWVNTSLNIIYFCTNASTGAAVWVTPSGKFGGTGADGALSVTSGTTTISFASAAVLVKNYSSVSITSTGVLGFSNPHANGSIIVIKSTGNVTITSSGTPCIDLRLMGAAASTNGQGFMAGPTAASGFSVGNGGTVTFYQGFGGRGVQNMGAINGKGINVFTGAGGQTGGGVATPGAGGRGGGGIYIECAGALNFTGAVDCSGAAGGSPSGSGAITGFQEAGGGGGSNSDGGAGTGGFYSTGGTNSVPGGGGGAGSACFVYNTLTANSGSFTLTGGAAGTGGVQSAGAGAAGWSLVALNTEFI